MSKITTQDCKNYLTTIFSSTKPEDWKRTKKYKIDDIVYRDFKSNNGDNCTIKEIDNNLSLHNEKELKIVDEKLFDLSFKTNLKLKNIKTASEVLEESVNEVGFNYSFVLDLKTNDVGESFEPIDEVKKEITKIIDIINKNFKSLIYNFSYRVRNGEGNLFFNLNSDIAGYNDSEKNFIYSQALFPFLLEIFNVKNDEKIIYTDKYLKKSLDWIDDDFDEESNYFYKKINILNVKWYNYNNLFQKHITNEMKHFYEKNILLNTLEKTDTKKSKITKI